MYKDAPTNKNSNLYKALVEINEENIENYLNGDNDNNFSEHSDERMISILKRILTQNENNSKWHS